MSARGASREGAPRKIAFPLSLCATLYDSSRSKKKREGGGSCLMSSENRQHSLPFLPSTSHFLQSIRCVVARILILKSGISAACSHSPSLEHGSLALHGLVPDTPLSPYSPHSPPKSSHHEQLVKSLSVNSKRCMSQPLVPQCLQRKGA